MRIALDVNGGDLGPLATVEGAHLYIKEFDADEVVLVGDRSKIEEQLLSVPEEFHSRMPIVHAPDNIEMNESPTEAIRKKKDSSMVVGLNLHKAREVSAFVSAGHTGAQMAGSLFALGRIHGVKRPGIGTFLPGKKGMVFVIDVGANVDSKPIHLLQFAEMGEIFVRQVFQKNEIKIGLLSIGEEEKKGNELTVAAHQLLKEKLDNFHGNVEGRDILQGTTDIVVCDGFVGNVVLKMVESVTSVLMNLIKQYIGNNIITNIGGFLVRPAFKELKKSYNYEEYGGVPLLGVNGISIICHGNSTATAIYNALKVAKRMKSNSVNERIAKRLSGGKS